MFENYLQIETTDFLNWNHVSFDAPDTFNFLRHVMTAICLSDQSALIDASL